MQVDCLKSELVWILDVICAYIIFELDLFQKFVIPKTEKRKMVEEPIPMEYSASVEAMVIKQE